jgi:CRP/FNR family transcriptional regulator, cyclic AMP receptor protein
MNGSPAPRTAARLPDTFYPDSSFYGALADAERAWLRENATIRTFRPGYIMTMEQEPFSEVLIFRDGWAKATIVNQEGSEIVLRIYGPGDLLGAEAALTSQRRGETVLALTECATLQLPARRFTDLLARTPANERAFSLAMLHRAQAADEQLKLRHATVDAALAHVLLTLAARAGTAAPDGAAIPFDLTQEDLAGILGVSRSTVARALHWMRGSQIIHTGYRTITIADSAELRRIASTSR